MATQMPTRADFEALLNEQLGGAGDDGFEGRVVKGTVTAIENRVLNRSDPEGFGFTLGLFEDPVLGLSHARAEDGPGYTTHLTYSLPPTPPTP